MTEMSNLLLKLLRLTHNNKLTGYRYEDATVIIKQKRPHFTLHD